MQARNRKSKHGNSRLRKKGKFPLLKLLLLGGGLLIALGILVLSIYGARSLQYDISKLDEMPELSTVYDKDGNIYHRLYGAKRVKVTIDKVSSNFTTALLAREDSRFYQHEGLDYLGIGRAVFRNITSMGTREGASTLTQQLARNTFPLGGRTLDRKLLEAVVAKRIEQKYSKQEILELYMNRIFFGGGLYGVETASLAYFGKHASELTPGEGALLAGIIRSPSRLSPFRNYEGSLKERDTVLGRMVKLGKLTAAEAEKAKAQPIKISRKPFIPQENYYMGAVCDELEILLSGSQMDEGGLRIYTTVDPELQRATEAALESQLSEIERRPGYKHPKRSEFIGKTMESQGQTPYLEGAAVVMDNRTGAIRALVGGRDYAQSNFNRATEAQRQVGSAFKPFIYAAAFARGMMPGMLVDDGPLRPGEISGAANWNPANSDGTYHGLMPAQSGLVKSRNTMSIRVGDWAGINNVRKIAEDAGLGVIPNQPVVFLGAFEESLLKMTAAYSIFPNNGIRRQTYFIERIDDADGTVIYRAAHLEMPVISPAVSWLTAGALRDVMQVGTAASVKELGFTKLAGGKTGTTNDFRDAWFLGFTSSLTCGVWVGLDHPETIMGRGYGSTLALPIWAKTMAKASGKEYPASDFKAPEPIVEVTLCGFSNALAGAGCQYARTSYTASIPQSLAPRAACELHQNRGFVFPGDVNRRPDREEGFGRRLGRSLRRIFGGE